METRIDISNELRDLSPLLSSLEKVNVFTAPDGYFDELASSILAVCKAEDSSLLSDISKQPVSDVPVGYFDGLAGQIMARIKSNENVESASDELRKLSPSLYPLQGENVFEVPTGYFEDLASDVMNKINNADEQTAAEELRALSPMLYSIQNENVYEVPKGYFADLPDELLSKVRPAAKVVKMPKRSNNFLKYAVAAMFTGVVALTVLKFTNNKGSNVDPSVTEGNKIAMAHTFDQELAKVSDDDIMKYLESSGGDVKSAIIANSAEDNELPSQEDYLLDEQALDKYLQSINVNDLKN